MEKFCLWLGRFVIFCLWYVAVYFAIYWMISSFAP